MSIPGVAPAEPLPLRVARICLHLVVGAVPFLAVGAFAGSMRLGLELVDGALMKVVAVQLLVFAGLSAWAVDHARGRVGFRWHRAGWLGVAYVLWVTVSAAFGTSLATGLLGTHGRLQGLLMAATYLAVFVLALQVVDSSERAKELARTLVFTSTALAAYGLIQFAGIDPITWATAEFDRRMAFATFGNPDVFGGYLVAPLAVAIGLFFAADDPRDEAVYGACMSVLAAGLLATFVRGAWIGAAIAVALMIAVAVRTGFRPSRAKSVSIALALGVVLVVAAFSAFSSGADSNVIRRVASAFDTQSGSVGSRLLVWGSSVRAIADDPLTGEGPDQFLAAYTRHEDPAVIPLSGTLVFADNAHSLPLHLAVTVGIPGALLFLAFFMLGLRGARRVALPGGGAPPRWLFAGMAAGAVGYIAYLLSGLEQPAASAVLWMLMGALLAPVAKVGSRTSGSRAARVVVAGVLAVVLLLVSVHGVTRVLAESRYAFATRTTMAPQVAVMELERAIALAPWEPEYRRAQAAALQRVLEAGAGGGLAIEPATALERADAELERARALSPNDFRTPVARSALYLAAASQLSPTYGETAAQAAQEAIRLRPASPAGYGQLALAYSFSGDPDDAIASAKRGLDLWPGYVDGRLALALLYERVGRNQEAADAFREVLESLSAGDPRRAAVQAAIDELSDGADRSSEKGTP